MHIDVERSLETTSDILSGFLFVRVATAETATSEERECALIVVNCGFTGFLERGGSNFDPENLAVNRIRMLLMKYVSISGWTHLVFLTLEDN